MNQRPAVSVVIPMFDAAKWIRETLVTVIEQTYPVEECIVVDDGSTDQSARIVRDLSLGSPIPIRLLQTPNRGVSSARNTGVGVAVGELVAFLDSDDLWNSHKIEFQVERMIESDAVICCCGYEIFNSITGKATGVVVNQEIDRVVRRWAALEGNGFAIGSTALVRKDFLSQFGGFTLGIESSEDFELFWRAHSLGLIAYDKRVLVGYRTHGAQSHRAFKVTVGNMTRIYDEIIPFSEDTRFERRCRANLDAHYGYNLLRTGRIIEGFHWLWKSFCRDPRRVVTLPLHAIGRRLSRWLRARLSPRRFFNPISGS